MKDPGTPRPPTAGILRRTLGWLDVFVRPIGDRRWGAMLRIAGVAALAAMPIAVLFPQKIPLIWFGLVALPATGPLSPIMPVALEPLIFEVAKYETPLWITAVAMSVYSYTEYINWHIYAWLVGLDRLSGLRDSKLARRSVEWFGRAPALTVAVFALLPIPFWPIRIVAILKGYPVKRFIVAMGAGRLPRLLFLSWVGAQLRISTVVLVAILVAGTLMAIISHRGTKQGNEENDEGVVEVEQAPKNGVEPAP